MKYNNTKTTEGFRKEFGKSLVKIHNKDKLKRVGIIERVGPNVGDHWKIMDKDNN